MTAARARATTRFLLCVFLPALLAACAGPRPSASAPGEAAPPQQTGSAAAARTEEIIPGVRELESEPFAMPDDFPLPDGVYRIDRDSTAKDIVFHTRMSVDELLEFYRRELTALGLGEHKQVTIKTALGFRVAFLGWPKLQAVLIHATDAERLGKSGVLARVVHARLAKVTIRDDAPTAPPDASTVRQPGSAAGSE